MAARLLFHVAALLGISIVCAGCYTTTPTIEGREGQSITLHCDCNSPKSFDVSWYKGPEKILSSYVNAPGDKTEHTWKGGVYTVVDGRSLNIHNLSYPRDHGRFLCDVYQHITINVTVLAPSRIKGVRVDNVALPDQTRDVVLHTSRSTRLDCLTEGFPAPGISWYLNGETLDTKVKTTNSITRGSTTVVPTRQMNGGNATCSAINSEGPETQVTIFLDVKYIPEVESLIVDPNSTLVEGQSARLTCHTYGNPNPSVNWTFNNVPINTNLSGTLYLPSITRSGIGNYTCISVNCEGKVSRSILIDVLYSPTISLDYSKEARMLTCCAKDGNPDDYTFEKFQQIIRGQLVATRTGKQMGRNYTLAFDQESYENTGDYMCTVGNGNLKTQTIKRHIRFQDRPVFQQTVSTDVFVELHTTLQLQVFFHSWPNFSSITWTKKTKSHDAVLYSQFYTIGRSKVEINVHSQFISVWGNNSIMTIADSKTTDTGRYIIVVENSVGKTSLEFFVTVTDSDILPVTWIVVSVVFGSSLVGIAVTCFVCGRRRHRPESNAAENRATVSGGTADESFQELRRREPAGQRPESETRSRRRTLRGASRVYEDIFPDSDDDAGDNHAYQKPTDYDQMDDPYQELDHGTLDQDESRRRCIIL